MRSLDATFDAKGLLKGPTDAIRRAIAHEIREGAPEMVTRIVERYVPKSLRGIAGVLRFVRVDRLVTAIVVFFADWIDPDKQDPSTEIVVA